MAGGSPLATSTPNDVELYNFSPDVMYIYRSLGSFGVCVQASKTVKTVGEEK